MQLTCKVHLYFTCESFLNPESGTHITGTKNAADFQTLDFDKILKKSINMHFKIEWNRFQKISFVKRAKKRLRNPGLNRVYETLK